MSKVKNQPRKQKSMQDRQQHGKAAMHKAEMLDDNAHSGEPMMMASPMPEGGMRMPSHKKEKRFGHN
jgi:hypothetical protein